MLRCVRVVMQRCEFPLRAFVKLGPFAIRFHAQLDSAVKSNVSRPNVPSHSSAWEDSSGRVEFIRVCPKTVKLLTRERERERERDHRGNEYSISRSIARSFFWIQPVNRSITRRRAYSHGRVRRVVASIPKRSRHRYNLQCYSHDHE